MSFGQFKIFVSICFIFSLSLFVCYTESNTSTKNVLLGKVERKTEKRCLTMKQTEMMKKKDDFFNHVRGVGRKKKKKGEKRKRV